MIEKLVSDLPEIYQPIYGHPELSGRVSRPCLDRLERITGIYDAMQRKLGRRLKVLDLGCAQGYFSLSLAERGACVHGIDYLDKNIAVCKALAQAHRQLQISFEVGRIEDVVERLEPGQYDLVLGLSVFHHIIHEKGADTVKALLQRIAKESGALIVELALREEPLYWASSQLEYPRDLLNSIAFVHEVARHATHLAPIPRPLFIASNRYWILGDRAEYFERWSSEPHVLAHGTHKGTRRYFFSADWLLKIYRLDHPRGAHNKAEFTREVRFLQSPPSGFTTPALLEFGETETSAWLAMQRLPGRLLLDLLQEGATIDDRAVLLDVLSQLAALEKVGLYHDDVRTWNVLVAESGTIHLIDFGSISGTAQDCVWPGNPFLSFFIFVREVATGVVDDPDPLRTISISPFGLPQPYRSWVASFWHRPLAEWSFQMLHQTLLQAPTDELAEPLKQPVEAWMRAVEEALQSQKLFVNHLRHQAIADKNYSNQMVIALAESQSRELALLGVSLKQARQNAEEMISLARDLEKQLVLARDQLFAVDRRCAARKGQVNELEQRSAVAETPAHEYQKRIDELDSNPYYWRQQTVALEAECSALRNSLSWRITAPLRGLGALAVSPLSYAMSQVLKRPHLSARINAAISRFPGLHSRLKRNAISQGLLPAPVAPLIASPSSPVTVADLSPRALEIYQALGHASARERD